MLPWILLGLAAVGHGCLNILAVNVTHGLGIRESAMRWVKPLFLLSLAALNILVLAVAWRGSWPTWPLAFKVYGVASLATATLGLPYVTIRKAARPLPAGTRRRSRILNLASTADPEDFIGHGPDSWWLRLPGNQAFEFEMTELELTIERLPPEFDGLSILHLSDLHLTPAYSRRFFEALFDQLENPDADLVVFTGDLIDDHEHVAWVAPLFSRLKGRLGQFGILGNHDYRHDIKEALDAMEQGGFETIEARWRTIDQHGRRLAIGGTSAPWGDWPTAPPDADFHLLLCHTPDGLYRAARDRVDLVLSGHTHGGQYRLPLLGAVLMPSVYSRRFDGGCFQAGKTLMYVSRGIAGQHPLRFNCRPEVARIVLRSPARTSPSAHFEGRREHVAGR